jgi:hypothetical protein
MQSVKELLLEAFLQGNSSAMVPNDPDSILPAFESWYSSPSPSGSAYTIDVEAFNKQKEFLDEQEDQIRVKK